MIVTAERKETDLQKTPIAVSAMTAEDMERLQITELKDIDINVPGLAIENNIAASTALSVVMRGSSEPNAAFLFSEPGIGLYMNGVYRRLSAGNVELADIERVEVARGPQGTLYGRNTLAGAINVVTRKPGEETYGDISLSYDSFETTYVKGTFGGAITDTLFASISGVYKDRAKGPFDNQYNGKDVGRKSFEGLQGNLVWNFAEEAELFMSAYTTEDDSDGVYGSPLDITTGEFVVSSPSVFAASSVNGGVEPFSTADQSGLDATLTLPINDTITLKYITSFNETDSGWGIDFTSGAAATGCEGLACIPGFFRISEGEQEQSSHELQLLGSHEHFDWIAGFYYFEEETQQSLQDEFFGFQILPANYVLDSESTAIYGQLSYAFSDALSLTVGARYTEDTKDFSGSIGGTDFATDPSWDKSTGKVSLDYQVTDESLIYASWSQGFKSGTFNAFASAAAIEDPLEPELVDSFEIGYKGTLLDNTLRLNTALFRADYSDLVVGGLGDSGLFTQNGGETAVQGLEVEATWVASEAFSSFLTLNYLFDYEWDDTSGSASTRVGDELPYARELQWTLGGTYSLILGDIGNIDINLAGRYDDAYYTIANHQQAPIESVDDRIMLNMGITFNSTDGAHTIWLNGNNINDEESYYRVANFTFLPTNTALLTPHEPVSYELGYKFAF